MSIALFVSGAMGELSDRQANSIGVLFGYVAKLSLDTGSLA